MFDLTTDNYTFVNERLAQQNRDTEQITAAQAINRLDDY